MVAEEGKKHTSDDRILGVSRVEGEHDDTIKLVCYLRIESLHSSPGIRWSKTKIIIHDRIF